MLRRIFFPNKPYLFKKRLETLRFGMLWYEKNRKNQESFYQGYFTFKPTMNKINIFIESKEDQLDSSSLKFFDEIERNYFKICEKLAEPLSKKLSKRKSRMIEIINVNKSLKLEGIAINMYNSENQKWSLFFVDDKNAISGLNFNFEKWNLISIT